MTTRIMIRQRHLDRQETQHPLAAAIFDEIYNVTQVEIRADVVDVELAGASWRRFSLRRCDSEWLDDFALGHQVKPTAIVLR